MRHINNSEEFFLDLKSKQPELYDSFEFLSEYKNTRTPIPTKCKKCGFVSDKYPRNLILGRRCQKCYKVDGDFVQRKTHEEFLAEINTTQPEILKQFSIIGKYVTAHDRIKVQCNTCGKQYNKLPAMLLRGSACKNCSSKSKIIPKQEVEERLSKLLPNYIFSEVDYTQNMRQKVTVACDKGHLSSMSLASIFRGVKCRLCSDEDKRRPDLLIEEMKKYPDVSWIGGEYKNGIHELIFECKHHGIFSSMPRRIVEGSHACPMCAKGNIRHYSPKLAERNKEEYLKKPCDLYLLRIEDIGYKVGISIDVKSRVNIIRRESSKQVDIIKVFPLNLYSAILYEDSVLNNFVRKMPENTFAGYTEVLDAKLEDILAFMELKVNDQ